MAPIYINDQDGSGEYPVGVPEADGQSIGAAYVNEQDGNGEQLVWQADSGSDIPDSGVAQTTDR